MGDIVQRLGATLSETIDVKSLNGGSKINAAAEAIRRWAAQPVDVLCIHVQRAEDCGIAPASKRKLVGHSPPSPSFNDEAFTSWVQCSRCSKWRRGVVGVAADEEWHCALNSDLNAASCEMPEEKTSETEEQGAIYQVERIVDERRRGGRRQYRVRWLGYTARDDTWEDEKNILDPLLLAAWRSKGQPEAKASPRQPPVQPEAKASLPLNPWLARLETASSDSVNVEECAWAFVAPSDCGRGLFAMTNLLPGQAICQYSGPILPLPLLQKGEYVLQVPRT